MVDKIEKKYRTTNLTNDRINTQIREHTWAWHIHLLMYKFTLFCPWIFLIVVVKAHLADENETGLGISEQGECHWLWKVS